MGTTTRKERRDDIQPRPGNVWVEQQNLAITTRASDGYNKISQLEGAA